MVKLERFLEGLVIVLFVCLIVHALMGCAPQIRHSPARPAQNRGYNLPPCEVVPSLHIPCQGPIIRQSACDKRFGEKLCKGEK